MTGARWYLVQAMPRREETAAQQLARQGFRPFLPRRPKTVRHGRHLIDGLAPYFQRYLFVQLDLDRQRWRSVNGTLGVTRLVSMGEHPVSAPRGLVEGLLERTDSRGVLDGSHLESGQRVRLVAGPFADQLARIERLDDSGRVLVLLEIMGGYVRADAQREYLVGAE